MSPHNEGGKVMHERLLAILKTLARNGLRLCTARLRVPVLGHAFAPVVCCALLGGMLSGCALGRDIVDVMPPTSVAPTGMAPAKIVGVTDKRVFEAAPRNPSTPSLQDAKDIGNPMITTRAFARKRGGFGAAFGDIVLPEGRTVAGLVRAATQKALQEKGYRVVEENSPDYARAVPVNVDIQEFWAWFSPGALTVTVECQATINMSGGAFVTASPPPIKGYASTSGLAATNSDFADVMTKALDDLVEKMKAQIKSP
jgi:uncharacterized lipoprotein YajG